MKFLMFEIDSDFVSRVVHVCLSGSNGLQYLEDNSELSDQPIVGVVYHKVTVDTVGMVTDNMVLNTDDKLIVFENSAAAGTLTAALEKLLS